MTARKFNRRNQVALPSRGIPASVVFVACLVPLAGAAVAWRLVGWPSLVLGAGGLLTFAVWLRGRALLLRLRLDPDLRKLRGIVVLSDSPHWREHIEREWLPRLGDGFVVLNWSEHGRWKETLPVQVWRHFCGHSRSGTGYQRNFNPAVIVLRGLRNPRVYRFYPAFQRAKHGDTEGLQRLEAHLFATAGGSAPKDV